VVTGLGASEPEAPLSNVWSGIYHLALPEDDPQKHGICERIGMATVSILLVDDEQTDRKQMRRPLQDEGYTVLEAGTLASSLASS